MAAPRHLDYEFVEHPDIERRLSPDEGEATLDQDPLTVDYGAEKRSQQLVLESEGSTEYFTGLRGVAALCVFTNHLMGSGNHERGFGAKGEEGEFYYFIGLPFLRVFYTGGTAAVSVFFVLSGFVITQSMVKMVRANRQKDFLKAWASAVIRRPVRLYVPCWGVALLVAFALHVPGNFHPPQPWLQPETSIFKELGRLAWQCWDYFQPWKPHASDQWWFIYDVVVWTIPIELKGSLMCYGLVLLYSRAAQSFGLGSPIHTWFAGTLFTATTVLLGYGYWWQACFTAGFMFTILHAYALDKPLLACNFTVPTRTQNLTVPASTFAIHIIFICSWYLLSSPATAGKPEWMVETPGWKWLSTLIPKAYSKAQFYRFWESWGSIGLVYSCLRIPWLQWIFSTKPIQYLGRVSFMLYLVHLPLAYIFSDRWGRAWGATPYMTQQKWWDHIIYVPEWGVFGFNLQWGCIWGTTLAVNLAVSHILTKYFDDPSVWMGKYITQRLGLQPAPQQTAVLGVS